MSAPLPAQSADSPYLLRKQRETLLCFSYLSMECSCISHSATCLYRGGMATQGETLQRSGLWLRVDVVAFPTFGYMARQFAIMTHHRWKRMCRPVFV